MNEWMNEWMKLQWFWVRSRTDWESLFFCGTPDFDCGVRKFSTPDSDSDFGPKKGLNSDSDSGLKIRLWLWRYDLLCDKLIVCLRMTSEKFWILLIKGAQAKVGRLARTVHRLKLRNARLNVQSRSSTCPELESSSKVWLRFQAKTLTPRDSWLRGTRDSDSVSTPLPCSIANHSTTQQSKHTTGWRLQHL